MPGPANIQSTYTAEQTVPSGEPLPDVPINPNQLVNIQVQAQAAGAPPPAAAVSMEELFAKLAQLAFRPPPLDPAAVAAVAQYRALTSTLKHK